MLTHTEYEEVFGWDSGYTLERFSERMHTRGYKYDDHYEALKRWHEEDMSKKPASSAKMNHTEPDSRSYNMEEFNRRANELPVYRKNRDRGGENK